MEEKGTVSFGEYLEMVEFTPEGRLRFDLLLDRLLPLVPSPEEKGPASGILAERLERLLELADPRDLELLRGSGVWRTIEEALDRSGS